MRYFCYHPGPNLDTLHWMLKKKIKWFGMDTGSADHPMNTSIRNMRPDIAEEFEKVNGKAPADYFGTFEYTHKRSGRLVKQDMFPFPQLRLPGRPAARREPRRRHRADARQALHHRRLRLALRRARRLPVPDPRVHSIPATCRWKRSAMPRAASSNADTRLPRTSSRMPIFAASQTQIERQEHPRSS